MDNSGLDSGYQKQKPEEQKPNFGVLKTSRLRKEYRFQRLEGHSCSLNTIYNTEITLVLLRKGHKQGLRGRFSKPKTVKIEE